MKKYPGDRGEKNRGHLATLVSLLLAGLLCLALRQADAIREFNLIFSVVVFSTVLILRTIFVEFGIRRRRVH